jgi:hypothetical protein
MNQDVLGVEQPLMAHRQTTAATRFADAGIDAFTIAALVGHSEIEGSIHSREGPAIASSGRGIGETGQPELHPRHKR